MQLASRFRNPTSIRSQIPLTDEQIMAVAPSIFAEEKHSSRSKRYTYIPTGDVLRGLRKEGFSPFMVCQTKCRDEAKREHTKHMVRLRHASQIASREANEIILLNSHDGSSCYQLLSGVYRDACSNGMVWGDTMGDVRFRHKGNITANVIEGAFRVLDDFELISGQVEGMKSLELSQGEQSAFASAALELRFDTNQAAAPITEAQVLQARRAADKSSDLWTTFNRVQENLVKGGLRGRSATGQVRATREVKGIDQNIKLNRALWVLAEALRKNKG